MTDVAPAANTGYVTVRNPTRTAFFISVNGSTQYRIDPDDVHTKHVRFPRSTNGNASDGEFGYQNTVDVAPESAGARFAPITLTIPNWLQTAFDLDLLIFYRAEPTIPDFVLHWGGLVVDYELAGIAVTAAPHRSAPVTPLHAADSAPTRPASTGGTPRAPTRSGATRP